MTSSTLPRPDIAVVPDLLRHAPSIGVLAGIGFLFASVGAGLPGREAPETARPAAAEFAQAGEGVPVVAKPAGDPTALDPIAVAQAMLQNAALPMASGPNPAAAAFTLPPDEVARMRSVDCLTAAVYYEAGLESDDGQRAVAQVVLNRVRHPQYPKTVCGVVFQGHTRTTGCQFTFTCDGSLRRTPAAHLWARSRKVAEEALAGYVHRTVGWATHYHANYVFPYWAPTLAKVAQIGAHIFYRWGGGAGLPGAFNGRYAGGEPDIRWRGGFGQTGQTEALAEAVPPVAPIDERDAAAAAAALDVAMEERGGTAFMRSILRRYEPVDTKQGLEARARATPPTASNRWALTGQGSPDAAAQKPLGRADQVQPAQPVVLDGVRRRPDTPTAPPAQTKAQ